MTVEHTETARKNLPLVFAAPRRGKPPVHLADLTPAERIEKVKELGLPGFRAKQLATHYFRHYTSDPAEMTDLLARLKAIDASRPNIPIPKGPVPTSMKGMRGNLRGR